MKKWNNKIYYSQCWEDSYLVKEALKISSSDNLIIITSGGCNVLNLSLLKPAKIVVVDSNPLQNFLLELKVAAVRLLNYQKFISFLGLKNDLSRLTKYKNLRSQITSQAAIFWDNHRNYIEKGILHCGRFEQYVEIFRNFLLPLIHNKREIQQLFSFNEINKQSNFYHDEWNNRRWRLMFHSFFNKENLNRFGRKKDMSKYCGVENIGEYFLKRLNDFFSQKLARENYFLYFLFTGNYQAPFYPPYLSKNNFNRLKDGIHNIEIITDDITNFINKLDKNRVYKFCFSDIFESFSQEETNHFFDNLVNHCAKGSHICFWNNLVNRYPENNQKLVYLEKRSEKLQQNDRVFFYKKFYVYERI